MENVECGIPESFSLLGNRITVKFCDDLFARGNRWGECDYGMNEIRLQKNTSGCERAQSAIVHTYFHELSHFILYFAGQFYSDGKHLHNDERLVDLVGGLMHQAMKTGKLGGQDF